MNAVHLYTERVGSEHRPELDVTALLGMLQLAAADREHSEFLIMTDSSQTRAFHDVTESLIVLTSAALWGFL